MNPLRLVMLALSVCLLCNSCQETEIKRRTVGYKGKAKSNPFLAAERFLTHQGLNVVSEHGLGRLDFETSTIFLPPSSINTVGRSKRLLEWVNEGGHLVLMMEGGDMGGNDFTIEPVYYTWNDELGDGMQHLFDELDVDYKVGSRSVSTSKASMELDDWEAMDEKDRVLLGSEKYTVNLGEGELEVRYWEQSQLGFNVEYMGDYGSEEDNREKNKHRFLSLVQGAGRVTVLSEARPLRNRYLGYADHAKFLASVVDLSRPGKVVFSSGEGDGFFGMLWRHFKMGVIGLLLVVALWLWRHLPRYGPEQDVADGGTREFSEQVRGIGRFLWRHKRDDTLLGALRAIVNRRLSLHPGMSQEGIFEQLSSTTGLPIDSVIEAMTREHITEPGVMVRVTKNLQKILKYIH